MIPLIFNRARPQTQRWIVRKTTVYHTRCGLLTIVYWFWGGPTTSSTTTRVEDPRLWRSLWLFTWAGGLVAQVREPSIPMARHPDHSPWRQCGMEPELGRFCLTSTNLSTARVVVHSPWKVRGPLFMGWCDSQWGWWTVVPFGFHVLWTVRVSHVFCCSVLFKFWGLKLCVRSRSCVHVCVC